MLVAHYFGLANSLAEVRQWCDERGIALIEDCAHCYFGEAGERPVGAWGDYATASLSKFLPLPESGLLASAHRPINKLPLTPQSLKAQLKGWVDVFELATKYKRFAGINSALALLFRVKNSQTRSSSQPPPKVDNPPEASAVTMMRDCDMARIAQVPLAASMGLRAILPRGRIITQRQQNFARYARHFANIEGSKPLFALPFRAVAPYVFPLWVDDADRIYHALRTQELPVFRWDRIWPGTPQLDGDLGLLWSQHVLQLLCHQDLSEADIERTARAILNLLTPNQASTLAAP